MTKLSPLAKFIYISLFWILIVIMNYSQTLLSSNVRGWNFIWEEQIIYVIGWLLWIGYTPFIIYLINKNPINEHISLQFILKILLIGLLFTAFHCSVNIILEFSLWNLFIETTDKLSDFYGVFFYKYHVNLFIFLFVMGAGYAIDYIDKSKKLQLEKVQLQNLLSESELMALKMQLNPHFLFNTHHNIIGLILNEEHNKAIKMLTRLSELLRITLNNSEEQYTTIEKEINTIKKYLEIHSIRFEDRLKIKYNISENLLQCKFPHLLLLPLVENALQHGISKRSDSGVLEIIISSSDQQLYIKIKDDGPGIKNGDKSGIGLSNTSKRLKQLFENNYSFSFFNLKPKGFEVNIKLPKQNDR